MKVMKTVLAMVLAFTWVVEVAIAESACCGGAATVVASSRTEEVCKQCHQQFTAAAKPKVYTQQVTEYYYNYVNTTNRVCTLSDPMCEDSNYDCDSCEPGGSRTVILTLTITHSCPVNGPETTTYDGEYKVDGSTTATNTNGTWTGTDADAADDLIDAIDMAASLASRTITATTDNYDNMVTTGPSITYGCCQITLSSSKTESKHITLSIEDTTIKQRAWNAAVPVTPNSSHVITSEVCSVAPHFSNAQETCASATRVKYRAAGSGDEKKRYKITFTIHKNGKEKTIDDYFTGAGTTTLVWTSVRDLPSGWCLKPQVTVVCLGDN